MSKFLNSFEKVLDEKYNISITENGAVGYATTKHVLLDMNFKVASYRHMSADQMISDFVGALNQDFELAIAWLFYARDVREGLGERRLFRTLFKYLAQSHPEVVRKLVGYIGEYGRYDDLMELLDTEVHQDVMKVIMKTLSRDIENMKAGKSISLLAKWMPSNNTSSPVTVARAKILQKALKLSPKEYRKMLASLRAYLNIVERDMSANNWSEINYEAVPSKANLIYKKAFMKHDEARRLEYLAKLEKGEAKINSAVAFPHDIVHKYTKGNGWGYSVASKVDPTLEAMWKALPDMGIENTIVVADGSGSMTCTVDSNSGVTALEVANALAIYTAERCRGEFKNTYITFSSRPQLVHLNGKTLLDNLKEAARHNEVANTNIEATFDLILKTAVDANMAQEDLPKNVLIISDMEFDSATHIGWGRGSVNANLFEQIKRKFAAAGYKVPRLIFWNVNSRSCTIPVKENDLGVALVSGFSVNILKMVMSDRMDPWMLLVDTLVSARYAPILNAITEDAEPVREVER